MSTCKHCQESIFFDELTNLWFHHVPEAPNGMRWSCELTATPADDDDRLS